MKKLCMGIFLTIFILVFFSKSAQPAVYNYIGDAGGYEISIHYKIKSSFKAVGHGHTLYIEVKDDHQVSIALDKPNPVWDNWTYDSNKDEWATSETMGFKAYRGQYIYELIDYCLKQYKMRRGL